ncbi:hypothetical protein Dsin_027837 [Dipteronia sinensis]|uniref:Uncharacterized protein n=1 Tax=Dipteronia sinensis TaxID=43782 RepID=A0AAE0DTY9_9ROSI|nr:hypothetical protein Dsin_027837 [Dipteronia sinensis]
MLVPSIRLALFTITVRSLKSEVYGRTAPPDPHPQRSHDQGGCRKKTPSGQQRGTTAGARGKKRRRTPCKCRSGDGTHLSSAATRDLGRVSTDSGAASGRLDPGPEIVEVGKWLREDLTVDFLVMIDLGCHVDWKRRRN